MVVIASRFTLFSSCCCVGQSPGGTIGLNWLLLRLARRGAPGRRPCGVEAISADSALQHRHGCIATIQRAAGVASILYAPLSPDAQTCEMAALERISSDAAGLISASAAQHKDACGRSGVCADVLQMSNLCSSSHARGPPLIASHLSQLS